MNTLKNRKALSLCFCGLFCALFFVASNVIPAVQIVPGVPFTLQIFVIAFCAYLLGIGPAFLPMVPCVSLGNAVYAVLFGLLAGKFLQKKKLPAAYGSMVLAAAAKFVTLYLVLVRLVAPAVVPAAKLSTVTAAFTWPQLLTAVIGGVLACLIAPVLCRALGKRDS